MEWLTCIKSAIDYIEDNLLTIEGPEEVAEKSYVSTIYLQRGFLIITGYNIGEYIRNRKLYLSALELINSDKKIIDIAYTYGYETAESFSKAFTRFHGANPKEIRKGNKRITPFLPLRVNITVQGGNKMDYTISKLETFKIIGFVEEFSFDDSYLKIPEFWDKIFVDHVTSLCQGNAPQNEIEQAICENKIGEFGVCIDDIGKNGKFRYMVGGRYSGGNIPNSLEVVEIPALTWAKFKAVGAIPAALQAVNNKIWEEWLPGNKEYELDGKINIEWYSPDGSTQDPNYQSEVWIPVIKK